MEKHYLDELIIDNLPVLPEQDKHEVLNFMEYLKIKGDRLFIDYLKRRSDKAAEDSGQELKPTSLQELQQYADSERGCI